jgi:hypothetical protein
MEPLEPALLVARLVLSKDTRIIGLARRQEMIEEARQFVGSGGDGCGSAEPGAHAPVEVA